MTALKLLQPSLAADHIEWRVLQEGQAEFSRGDLEPESAWTIAPEDVIDEQEVADSSTSIHNAKVDDTLNHIAYRCASLKGAYALELNKGIVKRSASVSEDAELVYRFLLACSRPETSQALGDTFTELCKLALQRFFGKRASVWNIDARSPDRKLMGTTTPNVVAFLAPKIGARVKVTPHNQLAAQGDGGCDLVATFDFNDRALGHLTVLAQCAASSNEEYWRNKIAEPQRFSYNYELTAPPVLCMFIPYVYRKADGAWENEANCSQMVLFDRGRILKALGLDKEALPSDLRISLASMMSSAIARHAKKAGATKKKHAGICPGKRNTRSAKPKKADHAAKPLANARKSKKAVAPTGVQKHLASPFSKAERSRS